MKKFMTGIAAPALACALAAPALAQDPAPAFLYATYSVCDLSRQDRADQIFERLDKPIYDAAVADGTITAWGWLAHHTGGKWRRVGYHIAPSLDALFAAQQKIGSQIDAKDKKAAQEFAAICSSHDDYIWRRVAGNVGTVARGKVGFSAYFVCDSRREAQADALVKRIVAPIYDKMVTDGSLTSWGWLEHIVGGEYRRLATTTAKDLPSLMKARGAFLEALDKEPLADMMTDICPSHADYIWEIRFEKP